MIPQIIHYCWFGPADIMSDEARRLSIASWQEKMPDYKIMRWDENNIDLSSLPDFAQHAYKNKRWAYVADVVRFQKLHEYGGVYLDTDMLIIKDPTPLFDIKKYLSNIDNRKDLPNINNKINKLEGENNSIDISIWGMEDGIYTSCGIIACNKNNLLIKDLNNFYIEHYKNNNMNVVVEIPKIVSREIKLSALNGEETDFKDYRVIRNSYNKDLNNIDSVAKKDIIVEYYKETFYPLPAANKTEDYRKFLTDNSYAVHLWNYSWQTPFMRIMRKVKIVQLGKAIVPKGLRPLVVNILRRLKLN